MNKNKTILKHVSQQDIKKLVTIAQQNGESWYKTALLVNELQKEADMGQKIMTLMYAAAIMFMAGISVNVISKKLNVPESTVTQAVNNQEIIDNAQQIHEEKSNPDLEKLVAMIEQIEKYEQKIKEYDKAHSHSVKPSQAKPGQAKPGQAKEQTKNSNWKNFNMENFCSIVQSVESGSIKNPDGIDKWDVNGYAIGRYQIHKVVVDDVNKHYGTRYKHQDMHNSAKAKDVLIKYITYWGNAYSKRTKKPVTYGVAARIWNGGPKGYNKEGTLDYLSDFQVAKNQLALNQ